jgi:AraC-like DNA-binding protein
MPRNGQSASQRKAAPTAPIPGRSIDPADFQDVARPIAAMAKDYPDGWLNAWHRHRRAQLVYASAGVMTIRTPHGTWVVPPDRALWIPPATDHEIAMSGAVTMRTVYIEPEAAAGAGLPDACSVVAVSGLLRELILRAVEMPLLYDEHGPDGRVAQLILDELRVLPALPLHLPSPQDPRLRRLCEAITRRPADDRTLQGWGAEVGASARTLARLFRRETGLSFGHWRAQARLLAALARLAAGEKVTSVALDLGYDSPSAFAALFRRQFGVPPSQYFRGRYLTGRYFAGRRRAAGAGL